MSQSPPITAPEASRRGRAAAYGHVFEGTRGTALILASMFVVLVGLHVLLSRGMPGPTIIDNELGYLANARVLSGGTAPLHPWFTPTNYIGYSLLLVPLYWVGLDPDAVYQGALVVNAVLGGTVVLIAYPLARGLFSLTRGNALLAAGVTGLYPAVLMNSSLAWAESLLFPLGLLTVLLAYRLLTEGTVRSAVLFGGVAGFLYMAHPRLLASMGFALVFIVATAIRRIIPPSLALVAGGSLIAVALVTRAAHNALLPRIYGDGGAAFADDRVGGYLDVLTSGSRMWTALLAGAGSVWYLALASCGLVIAGAIHLGRIASGRTPDRRTAARWVTGFALALMVGALIMSCMGIDDAGRRIDYRFYGRYAEAYGPLLCLAGMAGILAARTRRARVALWGSGAAIGVGAWLVMYFGYGPERFDAPEYTAGAAVLSAITPGWLAYPSDPGYRIHLALAVLAATALVGVALAAWSPRAAIAVVAGLFCVSAAVGLSRYVEPQSRAINDVATLQDSIALRDARAISYDRAGEQIFVMPLYEFHLPQAQFSLFDSDADGSLADPSSSRHRDGPMRTCWVRAPSRRRAPSIRCCGSSRAPRRTPSSPRAGCCRRRRAPRFPEARCARRCRSGAGPCRCAPVRRPRGPGCSATRDAAPRGGRLRSRPRAHRVGGCIWWDSGAATMRARRSRPTGPPGTCRGRSLPARRRVCGSTSQPPPTTARRSRPATTRCASRRIRTGWGRSGTPEPTGLTTSACGSPTAADGSVSGTG